MEWLYMGKQQIFFKPILFFFIIVSWFIKQNELHFNEASTIVFFHENAGSKKIK